MACDTSAPLTLRLSPLVSGGVYTAYLAYILVLLPKAFDYHNDAVGKVSHQAWLLFRPVNLQRFRTNKPLDLLPDLHAYAAACACSAVCGWLCARQSC